MAEAEGPSGTAASKKAATLSLWASKAASARERSYCSGKGASAQNRCTHPGLRGDPVGQRVGPFWAWPSWADAGLGWFDLAHVSRSVTVRFQTCRPSFEGDGIEIEKPLSLKLVPQRFGCVIDGAGLDDRFHDLSRIRVQVVHEGLYRPPAGPHWAA